MSTARDWVGENASTLKERRLSKDANGNVLGGVLPSSIGTKLGPQNPLSVEDFTKTIGTYNPTPPSSKIDVVSLPTISQTQALTVEQRIDQLKKKIAEYRHFLNVANVASNSSLMDLLFVNITKELDEITREMSRNVVQPQYPSPSNPFPNYPNWPGLPHGDTIKYYAQAEPGTAKVDPGVISLNNAQENG